VSKITAVYIGEQMAIAKRKRIQRMEGSTETSSYLEKGQIYSFDLVTGRGGKIMITVDQMQNTIYRYASVHDFLESWTDINL
jgi:hypothetical protein